MGEAEADAAELREFGLSPLAAQRARIDELTSAPELTPRRQRRLGRLRRAHGRLAQGLATAPFETALERGVIDAVTPLDFDDPASMAARTAEAETIAAAYGVAVSPLRPAEARALEARLDATVPEALPDALADLRAGFGDAAMAEIARRFATDRPHLAVALRLAKQSPDLAADILQGGRRLKQARADGKAETLRPTDDELRAASTRVYGSPTAYLARPAETEAATALYALRVADTTKPGFQPAIYEQAMRDVAPAGTLIDDFGALGVPTAEAAGEPGADVLQTIPQAAPTVDIGLVDSRGRPLARQSPDIPAGVTLRSRNPTEPSKEKLADFLRSLERQPSDEKIAEMLNNPATVKELRRSFGGAIAEQEAESTLAAETEFRLKAQQAQAAADLSAPEAGSLGTGLLTQDRNVPLIRESISKELAEMQSAEGKLEIDPFSQAHTHRNVFNRCPASPPRRVLGGKNDLQYADCEGVAWNLDKIGGDEFHGGDKGNRTFRASDPDRPGRGFQCVYSPDGDLIDSGPDMGTYDYVEPSSLVVLLEHGRVDVDTHKANPNYAPGLTTVYCK